MGKNQSEPAAAVESEPAAQPAAVESDGDPQTLDIVMRRDLPVGRGVKHVGDKIATVRLEPGVTMEFLGDAYRNSFAGVMT